MTVSHPTFATRQPHAVLDLQSRRLKAIKIERLLQLSERRQPLRLLEIGTGSGGIAHYLASNPTPRIEVDAVDIIDNRLVTEGFRFQLVKDTTLPFADGAFDVVLTNHVIEHVGDRRAQLHHLSEIRRVLRLDGIGYLAVPNRWMLVEPHYRLAFLSWWPHGWRSKYLKWRRGLPFYDCEPLTIGEAENLLRETGFTFENLCVAALRQTLELEYAADSMLRRFLNRVPDRVFESLAPIIPTLIYQFRLPDDSKTGVGEWSVPCATSLKPPCSLIGPQDDASLTESTKPKPSRVFSVYPVAGGIEGFRMVAVEAALGVFRWPTAL